MAVNLTKNNAQVPAKKKSTPFTVAIRSDGYQKLINNTLGDPKRAANFVTAITSAVSTNLDLMQCDPGTILSAGLLGETLQLSPSPQLGQYYIVPFKDNQHKDEYGNPRMVATFQLGYKGYIQLAIRSGQYKKLNALAIKEGELISWDPLNEELNVKLIENEAERAKAKTIGYYAMFEYLNGFKKEMYWSIEKMDAHAKEYSFAYKKGYGSSFWLKDFDSMAIKTMLRQLISKWGVMSIDFQKAYEADMGVLSEDKPVEYVDNVEYDFNVEADAEELPAAFEVVTETGEVKE